MREDPDALLLRAVLLTNGGRTEEAAQTARELLAQDELHAGAHYVMAMCCEHAGELENALEHDRAAIYLDADFAMPHLHLGLISKRRGDVDAARVAIERALSRLAREDTSRVLLFGGGFSREALIAICRAELRASGSGSAA
jgi:chemotaxis protein methyltransferase CheR